MHKNKQYWHLTERNQKIIALYFGQGESWSYICKHLGVNKNIVAGVCYRHKKKLCGKSFEERVGQKKWIRKIW